jgi:DNA polymerase III epsilon subunit-like protein
MAKRGAHLNGNVLGVIDTETTGFKAGYNDIIEVCVMILDHNLDPSPMMPFTMDIAPRRIENIDLEALRIQGKDLDRIVQEKFCRDRKRVVKVAKDGCDADLAADMFIEWFESLALAPFKKIMPIACNWAYDRMFLIDWLGDDAFNYCFHPQYRDVMGMALYDNDIADWRGATYDYPKCNLQYLCTTLGIQRTRAHTALDDVVVTAEVYKRLIQRTTIKDI